MGLWGKWNLVGSLQDREDASLLFVFFPSSMILLDYKHPSRHAATPQAQDEGHQVIDKTSKNKETFALKIAAHARCGCSCL